jgi:Zn-dependent peptidase ImmA (M78 family)/DNA-binding XRE family transcriptional regulator
MKAVTGSFEPSRLSVARRRKGWTRPELAQRTDIKPRTLTAYEMGERAPSAENLAVLARALDFPPSFFNREKIERLDEESISFRALSKMAAAKRTQALASGELAMEFSSWVERRFDLPAVDLPDLQLHGSPEIAAQSLRVSWGLADKSITDMVKLLESKGVRVFSLAEENRDLDAFSYWRDGKPYVFLNTQKSAERSRFDAAHELGHLVLHRHGAPNGRTPEYEANAFASAFLMPRTSLQAFAPRSPTLTTLVRAKHGWGVSVAALAVRMHEVGLLSEWHYRSLFLQIQSHGYRDAEPEPMAREMSHVWPQVFAALKGDGMTRNDVAEALSWPARELRSLIFQLVLSAEVGGTAQSLGRPTQPGGMRLVR